MGASNVRAALQLGDKLHERHRLVLVAMAFAALDRDDKTNGRAARLYYGGHHRLAAMLGEDPTSENELRAIRRSIAALRVAGLIEVERTSAPGRRAIYRLVLAPVGGHVQNVPRPVDSGPP